MSGELKHLSAGAQLTQAEDDAIGRHVLDGQVTDDIIVATSAAQLGRLAVAASRIIGKAAAGSIVALTATQVRTIINVANGAGVPSKTLGTFQALAIGGATGGNSGDFRIFKADAVGEGIVIHFKVPWDFTAITVAEIIVIAKVTDAEADWDLTSDYATEGEAPNIHSEADAATTYNVTNNKFFAVDVSGVLSALAAGDNVAIRLIMGNGDDNFDGLGFNFRYS